MRPRKNGITSRSVSFSQETKGSAGMDGRETTIPVKEEGEQEEEEAAGTETTLLLPSQSLQDYSHYGYGTTNDINHDKQSLTNRKRTERGDKEMDSSGRTSSSSLDAGGAPLGERYVTVRARTNTASPASNNRRGWFERFFHKVRYGKWFDRGVRREGGGCSYDEEGSGGGGGGGPNILRRRSSSRRTVYPPSHWCFSCGLRRPLRKLGHVCLVILPLLALGGILLALLVPPMMTKMVAKEITRQTTIDGPSR